MTDPVVFHHRSNVIERSPSGPDHPYMIHDLTHVDTRPIVRT